MFSYAARLVAIVALVAGLWQIVLGLVISTGYLDPDLVSRFTTVSSLGEAIDEGLYWIMFAVALGTLAEIGLAVRKRRE
ncbi:hypothetical protein GGE07_006042 [Sinorhizobium terangae]|uniref:Uncharacterized protein n=1 Tax=Sinorhizobium terangae TaxID=110322 RepID=A0A6N7LS44_SINTE|nr:hypothetical protein [Sinorhizobium terangae]MBB4189360.1 hypothetical protein [Sinorhizobium terangae]MQX18959.1 hypothetical protein [Sinorhizobium terangae]MQX19034.1 hypothetical protein [Sinorhizobium terangae]